MLRCNTVEAEKPTAEKIMRECAICGLVTDQSMVVCPDDGSALLTLRPDPWLGRVLAGKFEILSLLGTGGMGNVYKARQEAVDRLVAIKFLHIEKVTNATLKRFHREARAAASLSHANIVSFFDFGLTEDNLPYMVMDYVEGISLDELMQQGPLAYERCVPLFIQACDALQHAHDKGIIHRDIKPSNLMLVPQEDGSEIIKVLDFGVAKLLPRIDSVEPSQSLTQTGELFGSPQYMSPEQWAGQEQDARSDMYSLGCVMYETLTGRPPIRGSTIVETIYKHTHERPAPFKAVQPGIDVPEQLEAVIFKTLEKEPDARFPSMATLKRNLEFVPAFAEAEKKIPAAQPKTESVITQSPGKAVVIVAAMVGTILACAVGSLLAEQMAPEVTDAMQLRFAQLVHGDQSIRLIPLLETLCIRATERGNKSEAQTWASKTVSIVARAHPDSWALANEQEHIARLLQPRNPDLAKTYFREAQTTLQRLAKENRKSGQFANNLSSEAPVDKTILEIDEILHSENGNASALAKDRLDYASDLLKDKHVDEANQVLQGLLANKENLDKEILLQLADALANLAFSQSETGDQILPVSGYKQSIDIKTGILGAQSEPVAELQLKLGTLLLGQKRFENAEETLLDALANSQAATGGQSLQAAMILEELGRLYTAMNAQEKANGMFKLAHEMRQTLPSTPQTNAQNTTYSSLSH